MESFDRRLSSFRNWRHTHISPTALAEAGFYFIGGGDHVACFDCKIRMLHWKAGDSPWYLHAKQSPDCEFVEFSKGFNFITDVQMSDNYHDFMQRSQKISPRIHKTAPVKLTPIPSVNLPQSNNSICPQSELGDILEFKLIHNPDASVLPSSSKEIHLSPLDSALIIYQAMTSYPADKAISMGFSPEHVATAIKNQLDKGKGPFRHVNELIDSLIDAKFKPKFNPDTVKLLDHFKKLSMQGSNELASEKKLRIELEKENTDLKDSRLCKVCSEKDIQYAYIPCGHFIICGICRFKTQNTRECLICRKTIHAYLRVFL